MLFRGSLSRLSLIRRCFYEQGQISSVDNRREYFYYIDHQGMLFLDDAKMKNFTSCYKEKQFLSFFFRRLKKNETGKYLDHGFTFVSPCGPEMNYIRCEDTPLVFTHLVCEEGSNEDRLLYNHGDKKLSVPFNPEDIYMAPSTGRLYYPTSNKKKFGPAGLISDKLSIAWTEDERFLYKYGVNNSPSHFVWGNKEYKFNKCLASDIKM